MKSLSRLLPQCGSRWLADFYESRMWTSGAGHGQCHQRPARRWAGCYHSTPMAQTRRVRRRSMHMRYEKHMRSPDWAAKRQERLGLDSHRCRTCHHDGSRYRLEVHHATYDRFGHEDVENDLITLCSQCHDAITNVFRARRDQGHIEVGLHVSVSMTRKDSPNGLENFDCETDWRCSGDLPQLKTRRPMQ